MRRSGLFFLLLIALAPVRAQEAKRPLAIEDYYRIQTVAGPAISPDGRALLFTTSTRLETDNSTATATWWIPAEGSLEPTRVLHYGKDVTAARWTDGRLEYTAESERWSIDPWKAATPQKAPVRPRTGTAVRVAEGTSADAPPAAAVTSADGKWIAWARDRAQPKTSPSFATDFERRHEERFKGVTFDWKDFQRDGQPFPAPNMRARPAAQIVIAPASGGEVKAITDLDLRPSGITWHPDGSKLLYIADPDWRDELKYESPDLWMVTTAGVVTRLTNDGYVYSDAAFSPDGKYISFVRDPGTDLIIKEKRNHGGPSDLYLRPVAGGEPINLTASWDLEPGQPRWTPDGRFIYFTAGIGGESHLFRVAVPTASGVRIDTKVAAAGRVEQVTKGPRRLSGFTFDKTMTRMAYVAGGHDAPGDVYVSSIDGTDERRRSNVQPELLNEIALSKGERLAWPSYDGTQIEGWLMAPYGYDSAKGPYPLIVVSHGGPHSATGYTFDFKKQFFAANGYFVLDTNFRSSTGYGEAFKWATWGEWGKKDGEDVMSGIDEVLKRYPIDAKRVGHTGHSYGGFMTNWLITQYPDRFAAAITGAGISNWISDYGTADIYRTKETEFFGTPWEPAARERMIKQSPLTFAGNVKTPTLFVHGEVDQRVPYEEAEQMYFALARRGIPTKMIRYAGQPHGIAGHWNIVHRMLNELQWWNRYLKSGPSKTSS